MYNHFFTQNRQKRLHNIQNLSIYNFIKHYKQNVKNNNNNKIELRN